MTRRREQIPIFPLSNVVVFPSVQVPLHLFEPRYRQLAHDVLDGAKRIGMVVVRPAHVAEMAGDPPIFAVGCAGTITSSQKLPDGRYNIVLNGTQRFRILDELEPKPERLYRIACVEMIEDPLDPLETPRVAALRARIVELVTDLIRLTAPEREKDLPEGFLGDLDDASFVNSLCNALSFEPAEKQGLIEADSIPDRFERLASLLTFRVAELGGLGSPSSRSFH